MIETRHGGEVSGVDIGGIGRSNQTVGVCRVAHNARLDVLAGVLVHGLANCREDGTIVLGDA